MYIDKQKYYQIKMIDMKTTFKKHVKPTSLVLARLQSYKKHVNLLLLLFAFRSMFISICVPCLEIAEFTDSVRRSAP